MKTIPAVKLETSTPSSSGNPASTAVDKSLPVAKPASKAKLPVGVPPIPVMIDQKLEIREEKRDKETKKKEEPKQKKDAASKEHEAENLDPPFPAGRRGEEQAADRRGNGWFNVGPGVQEIGDEINHIRLHGLDDGAERNGEAGDDQYEGVDYDKEPQQKNSDLQLVEGEDEGEDEDDQIDYLQNVKQEKRE